MKFLIPLAAILVAVSAISYDDVLIQEYNLYKAQYGKSYDDFLENIRRMEIFIQNKYEVAQHNLKYINGEVTYEMEINEFSDWLPEEIDKMNGFNKEMRDRAKAGEPVEFPKIETEDYDSPDDDAPSSVNWVEKGAVSPVKNQGACGSCYAFSALGALESQLYLKNKTMVSLSEQQIVDCSGNFGCNGGLTTITFDYVRKNGGVNPESVYPYEAREGMCRFDEDYIAATCSKYRHVAPNEIALKVAVAFRGPISVGINAMSSLMKYKGGVYKEPKCSNDSNNINHAVLAVGYGTDPKTKEDYWLVKNSWGTGWGENGYFKLARNQNNMCGIATVALYPKL